MQIYPKSYNNLPITSNPTPPAPQASSYVSGWYRNVWPFSNSDPNLPNSWAQGFAEIFTAGGQAVDGTGNFLQSLYGLFPTLPMFRLSSAVNLGTATSYNLTVAQMSFASLFFSGTASSPVTVNFPASPSVFIQIVNGTTQNLIIAQLPAGGQTVTVLPSMYCKLYVNNGNVVVENTQYNSINLTGTTTANILNVSGASTVSGLLTASGNISVGNAASITGNCTVGSLQTAGDVYSSQHVLTGPTNGNFTPCSAAATGGSLSGGQLNCYNSAGSAGQFGTAAAGDLVDLWVGNVATISIQGKITTTGTGVNYSTTSDYRLKQDVKPLENAGDAFDKITAKTFAFKAEPSKTVHGFIAHEVQEVIPQAVSGEKDAVDNDGKIVPQLIDHSRLVPILWATVAELRKEVAELRALAGKQS